MRTALRFTRVLAVLALWFAGSGTIRAIGPHETALLVNLRSPESLELANTYAKLRGIPQGNIVALDLPDSVQGPVASISPEQFKTLIWEAARKQLADREIEPQILAWVYSAGFPIQVSLAPVPVSLHGMTFARNNLVPQVITNAVPQGPQIVVFPGSNLFRGPNQSGSPGGPPISFESQRAGFGAAMPLPAMTLAHLGARGLTLAEALQSMRRSAQSDGSRPTGRVYFVKTTDAARSGPREWQFEPAAAELRDLGIPAEVTSMYPTGATEVVGLMLGLEAPPIAQTGSFAPGSIAEHLTSWAGVFYNPGQVKLTEWLRAGASSSGGTITEPLALWPKFPHARLYTYLAHGCTAIEAWYQALAMPQQQIVIGDPLAKPFAARFEVELGQVQEGVDPGSLVFVGRTVPETLAAEAEYIFLLDGRAVTPVLPQPGVRWKVADLSPGIHHVRLVVYLKGMVRHQAFAETQFRIPDAERGVEITEPAPEARLDARRGWSVRLQTLGQPLRVALYAQGREVAQAEGAADSLRVDPERIGAGPVTLQPVAYYGDAEKPVAVRGAPVPVVLENRNSPPQISKIARVDTDEGPVLRPTATDGDGDPLRLRWFEVLTGPGKEAALPAGAVLTTGELKPDSGSLLFQPSPSNRIDLCVFPDVVAREYATDLYLDPNHSGAVTASFAGLIFGYGGTNRFGFFGVDGSTGAWMIGSARGADLTSSVQVGAPIRIKTWYRISVRITDSGRIEGRVDDRLVCVLDGQKDLWNAGPGGLLAGTQPARFRRIARAWDLPGMDFPESARSGEPRKTLWFRAEDPFSSAWKAIP